MKFANRTLLGEPNAALGNETHNKASTLVLQNFKKYPTFTVGSLHTSGEYIGCQLFIFIYCFIQVGALLSSHFYL